MFTITPELLLGIASAFCTAVGAAFYLGRKVDRLVNSIDHFAKTLADHETRIRALERPE
jgi:hypothetical protein